MRLGIAYNTMNKIELTKQTWPVLRDGQHALLWSDGSTDEDALAFFEERRGFATSSYANVRGGADAGIVHSLTRLLQHPSNFSHVGLVESDVMLDEDWQEPTMALFAQGAADGLRVGAVSARSYTDRVLVQRDAYAVMLNVGAGMIVMTRDAAQIVLETFRTGWWPSTVRLFGSVSGIDIRTFACFRGNEQWTTSDWSYEAQLARMGYATLALTPAKALMVGQNPSLEQQGLELTQGPVEARRDDKAFLDYAIALDHIRVGYAAPECPNMIHRDGAGMLFFPHQLGALNAKWQGSLELQWTNGFGPFAYRAGPGGASLLAHVSGACSVLADGGRDGARMIVEDMRSGFRAQPVIAADSPMIQIPVSGGPIPRQIQVHIEEGGVFYGLQTADPQMIDTTFKFSWDQLPEAK
jgi:hypothetical protein